MEQTVEELLLIISEKENDIKSAEKSFSVLYYRYAEFLDQSVKRQAKSNGLYDEEFVNSVVNNVFYEVFKKPLGFSFDVNRHKSEDTAFKAWISVIAKNKFNDLLRSSIKYF